MSKEVVSTVSRRITGLVSSMRFQVLAVVAVPTALAAVLAVQALTRDFTLSRAYEGTARATSVARAAGALVHELQRERGLTAAFLASDDPRYRTGLDGQRPRTDAARSAFEATVASTPALAGARGLTAELEALEAERGRVDTRAVGADAAVARYTKRNAALLALVQEAAASSPDPALAKRLTAYAAFLQAKERAGLERTARNNALLEGSAGARQRARAAELEAAQTAYLDTFLATASAEDAARYRQLVDTAPFREVEALRRAMAAGAGTGSTPNPGTWWTASSARIDALEEVEAAIGGAIVDHASGRARRASGEFWSLALALGIALVVTLAGCLWVVAALFRRVATMVKTCETIERDRDLTQRLPETGQTEWVRIARAFNKMQRQLQKTLEDALEDSTTLAGAAQQLSACSTDLVANTTATKSDVSMSIMTASTVSMDLDSVAQSTAETNEALDRVTESVREITSSIHEVAENASTAAAVVNEASRIAHQSSDQIAALERAAESITGVVKTIEDIAKQTNLLALNATIEAARAGEAGKGFAVVAGEVKQLARQTAEATTSVREQVEGIRGATSHSVQSIQDVLTSIGRVEDSANAIAAAVEQQSAATQTISQSLQDTTSATGRVTESAKRASEATVEITGAFHKVDESATKASEGAEEVGAVGFTLAEVASKLAESFTRFRVHEGGVSTPAFDADRVATSMTKAFGEV